MRRLLVLGYYDKRNLGDQMFQETLPLLVPDFTCDFISTDDFKGNINQYDGVICGAGDIFNEYFMSKIEHILMKSSGNRIPIPIPIYIVGMGIPYPSMFQTHYLSLFDHVFLRETSDLPELTYRIGGRYAHALPDMAFLKKPLIWTPKDNKKTIGVFLAQPMRVVENYINSTIELLKHAAEFGNLKFIRFNYSESPKEDDKFIQNEIQTRLAEKGILVDNDLTIYTTDQVVDMMSTFHFAICARFHSHIYATIAGCPFMSIATTRKVELFLKEEQLKVALNTGNHVTRFDQVWEQRVLFSEKLQHIAKRNHSRLQTKQINNLLMRKSLRPKDIGIFEELNRTLIYESARKLLFKLSGYDLTSKSPDVATIGDVAASKVAAHICFEITKNPGSKYEWGTVQNIKAKPWELKDMINWIIEDVNKEKLREFSKLDLDFYDQNGLNGLHRAGWQYVLTYLRILNNNRGVLCDTFTDRTFIWGKWSLTEAGILPYTNMWIGFIHHTPNREHTDNNCWEIIKSPEFVQSLATCRGIICLSEYLSQWFRDRFKEFKVNIPVVTLFHPTLFVNSKWNPSEINWDRLKLINIGAWYRNPFSIYQVNVPSNVKKMSLKGPKMEDYFRPYSTILTRSQILNPNRHGNKWIYYLCFYLQKIVNWQHLPNDFSLNLDVPLETDNPELSSLYYTIQNKNSSVEIIEKLDNIEYDKLLIESIVFIHLVDASAVNTIIECIVRETPLLINRHPALEEYLGKDYPLFYDNLNQVTDLLQPNQVLKAHQYLKEMDKEFLKIEKFLSNLIQTNIYQNLFES